MPEDGYDSHSRKPDPIDMHVGSRVRLRRMVVGMSQEKLGERMGLTFQQIQKYEKGTNRIGASRLLQLSHILDVPVQFFFEEGPIGTRVSGAMMTFAEPKQESYVMDFINTRDGLELNRAFVKISDPRVRRRVIDLVRALSDEAGPGAEPDRFEISNVEGRKTA
jgi:transcriptional regulator with XRE-family HTH domain